ncbi:Ger(x)C family spore germination protein [Paenibacillus thiaminolyticus]|uniref:Ger(x)C family spore germination protein n=1 Tax=Paenibacillus thiaminolyticus TaxID=49283 RepID=UPI0011640ADD|nr:Ger(x)C family spore germination protein [Paenibacillus thiaminolyticus]NGP59368.1 Ger(x)C family spore germination protein [Paenibacillus thiaminolyticus]
MRCRMAIIFFEACVIATLLAGCWDQQMLKDDRIAYIIGLDLNPDGKLQSTISILDVSGSQTGSETGMKKQSEIHTETGNTSRHTRDRIDREVAGRLSLSKLRVILIGEDLARQGVYPFLDVLYRAPRSALNAKIAVVEGKAHDMINLKLRGSNLIGEHYNTLIRSAERRTVVPAVNLQLIRPPMLDPGADFAVPYISHHGQNPSVYGIALFADDKMAGKLKSEDSLLYLLMANKLAKTANLTLKVNEEGKQRPEQFIGMDIQSVKRKLKVYVQGNRNIKVMLDLKIKVTAIEYPKDHLNDRRRVEKLDKKLSEELTKRARAITEKMLQNHHDGFGIGRRIMAYYPNTWRRLNWNEDYAKVELVPNVKVEIVNHGIMY